MVLSWPELGSPGLSWDELVLRGSERLRCAQEEKVVASQLFRKENEQSQAVLHFSAVLRNQASCAQLGRAGMSFAEVG